MDPQKSNMTVLAHPGNQYSDTFRANDAEYFDHFQPV